MGNTIKSSDYPLVLSNELVSIIKSIDSPLSKELLYYNNNFDYSFGISFINTELTDDVVSFLPNGKIESADDQMNNSNRQTMKFGRLLSKISAKSTASTIEDFINQYKAIVKSYSNNNFEMFEDQDIIKFYSGKLYYPGAGSLQKSCMRHDNCKNYFDLYVKNPDKCKILVLFDDKKERILARSLVWFLDEPKGVVLMDRIYGTLDVHISLFKIYAKKQGWIYKRNQTFDESQVILDGSSKYIKMTVQLNDFNYKYFPYLDTLHYYDRKNKVITNSENDYQKNCDIIKIKDIHGGYRENENFVYDIHNKKMIRVQDSVYCEYGDGHTLKKDAVNLKYVGRFCLPSLAVKSEYDGQMYYKNHTVFSKMLNSYINKQNSYKVYIDNDFQNYDYLPLEMKGKRFEYCHNQDVYLLIEFLEKRLDKYYSKNEKNIKTTTQKEMIDEHFDEFFKYLHKNIELR